MALYSSRPLGGSIKDRFRFQGRFASAKAVWGCVVINRLNSCPCLPGTEESAQNARLSVLTPEKVPSKLEQVGDPSVIC